MALFPYKHPNKKVMFPAKVLLQIGTAIATPESLTVEWVEAHWHLLDNGYKRHLWKNSKEIVKQTKHKLTALLQCSSDFSFYETIGSSLINVSSQETLENLMRKT